MTKEKKNLSPKSIEKIRQVYMAILAQPGFYDQEHFPDKSDCGAECCFAGWAIWKFDRKLFRSLVKSDSLQWPERAEHVLGIKHTLDKIFFSFNYWPNPFKYDYRQANSDYERAFVLARRLEHYIATDGQE